MKKLIEHIEVTGKLVAESGLRIGAGGGGLEIGGLDNPILRHPVTKLPYVPGSSIKGKLRSLLEVNKYQVGSFAEPRSMGGPCGCGACVACWLFGCGDVKTTTEPSRLIFRDCKIAATGDLQKDVYGVAELKPLLSQGIFYSEVKAEVSMDRNSGKVGGGGPRSQDRIAAGTVLDFRITVRIFEGDSLKNMQQVIGHAFFLLEAEGLGGSLTRGYGQVKFEDMKWGGSPWDFRAPETSRA